MKGSYKLLLLVLIMAVAPIAAGCSNQTATKGIGKMQVIA